MKAHIQGVDVCVDTGAIEVLGTKYWSEPMTKYAGWTVDVRAELDGGSVQVWHGLYFLCSAEPISDTGFVNIEAARSLVRQHREKLQREQARIADASRLVPESETAARIFAFRQEQASVVRAAAGADDDAIDQLDQALGRTDVAVVRQQLLEGCRLIAKSLREAGKLLLERCGLRKGEVFDGLDAVGQAGHAGSPVADDNQASADPDAAHRLSGGAK